MSYGQWSDYNKHDPGVSQNVMPDWFKTNAKWWKDGLISDSDMVNALESLMVQNVIPMERFVKTSPGLEHQAGTQKGATFEIPSYQKDVFGFWGDGIISDSEILNSIGHLMSEGIINSQKIQEKRQSIQEKQNEYKLRVYRDSLSQLPPQEQTAFIDYLDALVKEQNPALSLKEISDLDRAIVALKTFGHFNALKNHDGAMFTSKTLLPNQLAHLQGGCGTASIQFGSPPPNPFVDPSYEPSKRELSDLELRHLQGGCGTNSIQFGERFFDAFELVQPGLKRSMDSTSDQKSLELYQLRLALDDANFEVVKAGQKIEDLEKSNKTSSEDLRKANADFFKAQEKASKAKLAYDNLRAEIAIESENEHSLNRSLSTRDLSPSELKTMYSANAWYQISAKWLQSALNGEVSLIDDSRKKAWDDYSKTKDKNLMNKATLLENSYSESTQNALDVVDILNGISSFEKELLEYGKKQGISKYDFEKETKKQQEELNEIKSSKTTQQIDDAADNAKKAKKKGDIKIAEIDSAVQESDFSNPVIFKSFGLLNDEIEIELLYKKGIFRGDPCDEPSKSIYLEYRFDLYTSSFITGTLKVDHYFEGKKIASYDLLTDPYTIELPGQRPLFTKTITANLEPGLHSFHSSYLGMTSPLFNSEDMGIKNPVIIEVLVPPCLDRDSAVDDSDGYVLPYDYRSYYLELERMSQNSEQLQSIIDSSEKNLDAVIDGTVSENSNESIPIDDDHLPGLDDEEEVSPQNSQSSVIPDSTSYDYTISVDYPMYRYVGDQLTCNDTIDKHLFGWWMNIRPAGYDVDSGVFVGKIKVEHHDGTIEYLESPIYDEPTINGKIDAGPNDSIAYASLIGITSPVGYSINFDASNSERITMTTPSCTEGSSEWERMIFVPSYLLDEKYFPIHQFVFSEPDACTDYHYHSATGTALSTEFVTINDPSPNGCGFGTSSMIPQYPMMSESNILEWESITGIDLPDIP